MERKVQIVSEGEEGPTLCPLIPTEWGTTGRGVEGQEDEEVIQTAE